MANVDLAAAGLFDDEPLGVVVEAPESGIDLAAWLDVQRDAVEDLASRHPVVLLRGFSVPDEAAFARVRDRLIPKPADYVYRSTPRTSVGDGILTATEYPASEEILLHCENAYQRDWPLRLVFCCLIPAETGGQTPVCDVRRVTERLGDDILDTVERRGIRYIRNYHPGFDLDWRTVFQTEDRGDVEAFCAENGIEWEWLPDGHLRTAQICQGVATHPVTGERVWFNQAHLFHPSALGDEAMEDMIDIFGSDGLPRDARYGDGEPIAPEILDRVRRAFADEARQFDWRAGDVTVVDNMLAAHGRRPFTGARRVLVSMGLMASAAAGAAPSSATSSRM